MVKNYQILILNFNFVLQHPRTFSIRNGIQIDFRLFFINIFHTVHLQENFMAHFKPVKYVALYFKTILMYLHI